MIYFVGAGSGAVDLITVRGQNLLKQADIIIYAGSLVNPEHLQVAKPDCEIFDSAGMTLEEVIADETGRGCRQIDRAAAYGRPVFIWCHSRANGLVG